MATGTGREGGSSGGRKGRILVVDDEDKARALARRCLERIGLDVTAVSSSDEALRLLEREDFDALVVDFDMPGGTGMDLFRAAKSRGKDFTGCVVFVGGTAPEQGAESVLGECNGEFLPKPYHVSALVRLVQNAALRGDRG